MESGIIDNIFSDEILKCHIEIINRNYNDNDFVMNEMDQTSKKIS